MIPEKDLQFYEKCTVESLAQNDSYNLAFVIKELMIEIREMQKIIDDLVEEK